MKRIALISDIHSNLPALKTALEDIKEKDVDKVYCLGDIVGYQAFFFYNKDNLSVGNIELLEPFDWELLIQDDPETGRLIVIAGKYPQNSIPTQPGYYSIARVYFEGNIQDENFNWDLEAGPPTRIAMDGGYRVKPLYGVNSDGSKVLLEDY